MTSDVIERLVARVTRGFKGDVGVVPRQFLRQFVNMLDLVEMEDDYDPITAEGLEPAPPTEDEKRLAQGEPAYEPEPEDAQGYELVQF